MATNTKNYNFKKPDESDFYDIQDQNGNWDIADEKMEELSAPTFEDYSGTTSVPEASTAIEAIKSKKKIPEILANIKAAFKGVCLLGHIVNNCVTDNAKLPLSAAQGKALMDQITKLNSEAFFVPVSYFRDKINKTYSRIEVFIFGKLVVIRLNVLVDDFDKYYGEATDDLRNIPALAHLSDTLEVRTPGSVRTNDNVTTLKQYGTILISGGKIFANMPEKTISSGYISGQIITYLLQ